jgi:hypothetical protein
MSTKVVGNDVSIFSVTALDSNGNPGGTVSFLSRWESIEITRENVWGDVTSSDAQEPEERYIMNKWSASIKGFVDSQGSTALDIVPSIYILVVFTEVKSGKTMRAYGGIDKGSATYGQMNAKDSLEISSKGQFGGHASLTYA